MPFTSPKTKSLKKNLHLNISSFLSAQKEYRAPFVWAQFDVSANVLVNIECRAYADNIEHERVTRRGLTKIVIKVQN